MRPKSLRTTLEFNETQQSGMIQLGPEGTQAQFCCTKLPRHWRSNKSLAAQFRVIAYDTIPDDTRCSLLAGNDENHSAQLKNNVAFFHNNVAEFSDLRFVGKSGRGKLFNVTITIWTDPIQVLVYRHAIKVTADGPRPPRPKSGSGHGHELNNTSSDSSDEGDSQEPHEPHAHLIGVEKKKPHRTNKPRSNPQLELSHLGLGDVKSFIDMNRPPSCHSNSSTITTTTASIHSLASSVLSTSSSTTPLQYLAAVVAANLMHSTLCQPSQQLGKCGESPRPAAWGHKPWLKPEEKQIWRPYIEDSH